MFALSTFVLTSILLTLSRGPSSLSLPDSLYGAELGATTEGTHNLAITQDNRVEGNASALSNDYDSVSPSFETSSRPSWANPEENRGTWTQLSLNFTYPEHTSVWNTSLMPHPKGPNMCFSLCNLTEEICANDLPKYIDRTSHRNPQITTPKCPKPYPLPYYATIGYSQAGSTFFTDVLTLHENVDRACRKEIHYFDHTLFHRAYTIRKHTPRFKIAGYSACLQGRGHKLASGNAIVGDNTIKQIYVDAWQPVWLKAINPEVKLMIILRNPVKRSYSRYSMRGGGAVCHNFLDPSACARNFDAYVPGIIRYIRTKCPYLLPRGDPGEAYACANAADENARREDVDTVVSSMYYHHIRHWLNFFPPEQFLVLQSDHLFADPFREVNRALHFLGLNPFERSAFDTLMKQSVTRSNSHIGHAKQPKEETLALLEAFFLPFMDPLYEMLHDVFGIDNVSLKH